MLEILQLLEPLALVAEKLASIKEAPNTTPPTPKPVDVLREKIAGGTPSEIADALKRVVAEGTNLCDLFAQDTTMLRTLGSRLARTENKKELNESLGALGEDLKQIAQIKTTTGSTLVSETVFFAERYRTAPHQLKSVLTELKKLDANLDGADSKLLEDSHTAQAIRGILSAIKKGADWFRHGEE